MKKVFGVKIIPVGVLLLLLIGLQLRMIGNIQMTEGKPVDTVDEFLYYAEQIEKINILSKKENRSASVIVGMAIDAYYECALAVDEFSEMESKQVPFVPPILHDKR
jgi:hypothetical protein